MWSSGVTKNLSIWLYPIGQQENEIRGYKDEHMCLSVADIWKKLLSVIT